MIVRDAELEDLDAIYEVWYATETVGLPEPPSPRTMPWFGHVHRVGRLVVAAEGDDVVGFAGVVDLGSCVALTDLFVRPDRQSRGIGSALLDEVLPPDRELVTMASADPRAIVSYIRRGLRPRWPAYYVAADAEALGQMVWPSREVEVAPLAPGAYRWQLPGDDVHYRALGGRSLVVRAHGRELGTALVVRGSPQRLAHPDASELLESSAHCAEDAADVVLAVVRELAAEQATRVIAQVPGPHAALAPLLAGGFAVTDTDMACATSDALLADPARHTMHGESRVASG